MTEKKFSIHTNDGVLNPYSEIRRKEREIAHRQWVKGAGATWAVQTGQMTSEEAAEWQRKELAQLAEGESKKKTKAVRNKPKDQDLITKDQRVAQLRELVLKRLIELAKARQEK